MRRSLTAVLSADVVGYSRLVSEDSAGTLAALRRLRTEVLGPVVASRGGRVIKSMGDGWIVTFTTVSDAVECAITAQDQLTIESGLQMRVGIHIGDVAEDDGDVYGDGVNVAARLQEMAEPGAVAVSDAVYALLDGTLRPTLQAVGDHLLRNIPQPVRVWVRKGAVAGHEDPSARADKNQTAHADRTVNAEHPVIRFATAGDGAKLAYAVSGRGPGLIRVGHYPSHLELDWQESFGRALFDELGRNNTLVRFDQRGTGLSDIEIDEVDLARCAEDMCVVADAAGLDRFVVFGSSGSGSATALHLAAQYPDRVAGLILLGGCADGRAARKNEIVQNEPIEAMLKEGWDQPDSPFLSAYISLYFPEVGPEKVRELARQIQQSAPKQNAIKYRAVMNTGSLSGLLEQVHAPTLILHARGDTVHPLTEGRKLARGITGAEMVVLESRNHYPNPSEACWPEFCHAMRSFLDKINEGLR